MNLENIFYNCTIDQTLDVFSSNYKSKYFLLYLHLQADYLRGNVTDTAANRHLDGQTNIRKTRIGNSTAYVVGLCLGFVGVFRPTPNLETSPLLSLIHI